MLLYLEHTESLWTALKSSSLSCNLKTMAHMQLSDSLKAYFLHKVVNDLSISEQVWLIGHFSSKNLIQGLPLTLWLRLAGQRVI